MRTDLDADLGVSFGAWTMGDDVLYQHGAPDNTIGNDQGDVVARDGRSPEEAGVRLGSSAVGRVR